VPTAARALIRAARDDDDDDDDARYVGARNTRGVACARVADESDIDALGDDARGGITREHCQRWITWFLNLTLQFGHLCDAARRCGAFAREK